MSLNAAAQHLAAHGRGPDNTLVHMSRGEVKGLQDLAMAHGGSLSINPQTGLPEAGFLSSLLPMIGGAALTAFSGGAINPMMASMIMGGVTGVASGSLSKGLMAGLGAYGGAGMMGGLLGAGQGGLAAQGVQAGIQGIQAGMPQFGTAGMDTASYAQQVEALRSAQLSKAAEAPFMEQAKAGFSKIGEAPGQFFKDNLRYAAAAAPSVIQAITPTTKQPEIKSNSDPGQQYKYSPGRVEQTPDPDPLGREQTYFKPMYTPITQQQAKSIYGFAGGGPVEEMSNANAIGANTGYPMADINKGAYATPYQTPISRNVLSGVSDTGVNPMTGEMNFAGGGITGQGNLNLQIPLDLGGGGGGGGFGQQGANGYRAAGSGNVFGGQPQQQVLPAFQQNELMTSPAVQRTGQFGQTNNQGFSGLLGLLGSLGGRGDVGNVLHGGIMPRPSYDAYTAHRSRVGATDAMPTREQYEGVGNSAQMTFPAYGRFKEGGSVASYQDGGVATATPMPDQYSYDPLTQMFNKIESMPSDNQPKPKAPQMGGNQGPMSDAAFAKQQSEGQKNLQAMQDGTMMSRIGESLSEGLTFMAQNSPTMALISAITNGLTGGTGQGMSTPGLGGFSSGTAGLGFAPGTMGPSHAPGPSGGGGGGGGGGASASGSGGGAAAMGAAGMSGTASGAAAAGAARGGLMAAYANGGSHLGDYSDGGRLLKGPGDGVSDSIPAMIGRKQPARLADGEFVVPARIVSELGNGSTEAGARKLYAMMDRVQKARGKTVGKGRVAKNSRAERFLPA